MKKILLLLIVLFFSITAFSEAQQGCCSWHGGVCGNSCCDGTTLSNACNDASIYCTDEGIASLVRSYQDELIGAYGGYNDQTSWSISIELSKYRDNLTYTCSSIDISGLSESWSDAASNYINEVNYGVRLEMYNTEMLNALEKSDIPTAIYYIEEITKMLLEMGEYDLYTEYMGHKKELEEIGNKLTMGDSDSCVNSFGSNAIAADPGKCKCKDGYQRASDGDYCEAIQNNKTPTLLCQEQFGQNTYSDGTQNSNGGYKCSCDTGYQRNSNQTSCVKEIVNQTPQNELEQTINWMYENELTIFSTPATFMIDKEITREQASKFFVVLARIFTTIQPDISKIANFNDIEKADRTLKPYITEAFQMDIFQGTNNKFLPFNNLTQAQALAVITRVIFGKVHEERIAGKPRYQKYRDVANQYNILQNLGFQFDSLDKENISRGDMALIIKRYTDRHIRNNPSYCESPTGILGCVLDVDCPAYCKQ